MSTVSPALTSSILSLLENTSNKQPSKIALIHKAQEISFEQLHKRSNQLANFLQERLDSAEGAICFSLDQSIEKVLTMIAIWKSGKAYVSLDASFTQNRLEHMMKDTASPILITTSNLVEQFSFFKGDIVLLDKEQALIETFSTTHTANEVNDKLAYFSYTSGSTGLPKAVMVEHKGMMNFINEANNILATDENHISLQMASSSFDSAILDLWVPLAKGLTINLYPDNRLIGSALLDYIREHNINFLPYIPVSILSTLPTDSPIGNLKKICTGGEAPTQSIIDAWKGKVELYNMYGPTETSVAVSGFKFNDNYPVTTIGKAFENVNAYILDSELKPVAEGSIGELCIGGVQVARGYLNQPELTAEKFINFLNPKGEVERIYRTGDLVYRLPDGAMVYSGRADQQVKIRGYRVEPAEIEENIYKSQLVNHCAVIVKDEIADDKYLVCYYTNRDNKVTYADELRKYLVDIMPAYMIPTRFLQIDEFPHTANGKVDKKALKSYELKEELRSDFVPASTPLQLQLAAVWLDILKIKNIGIHDSFFQYGGNSILAYKTIAILNKTFDFQLKISDLFANPTLLQLEDFLLSKKDAISAVEKISVCNESSAPLTFQQQSLWFLNQLHGSVAYNIGATYKLNNDISIDVLEKAFVQLIKQYPVLNSVFKIQDNMPYQTSLNAENWSLHHLYNPNSIQIQGLLKQPFDLESDFMLKAYIAHENNKPNQLILIVHHMVTDGWSMPILIDALNNIYNTLINKTELPFPKNNIDYYSYAHWQRKQNFNTSIGFWKGYLADAPILQLPHDYKKSDDNYNDDGSLFSFRLDATLTADLKRIAQQNNTTLYTTLLSAFGLLMQYYSGQNDICIGTVVANRNTPGTEDILGYFANMLPLRIQIDGNPTFNNYLQSVQKTLLDVLAHHDTPLETIITNVVKDRIAGYNPLFQTAFIVQDGNYNIENNTPVNNNSVTWLHNEKAKFDLQFEVIPNESSLAVNVEYKNAFFAPSTIENMSKDFTEIIKHITLNASQKVGDIIINPAIETSTSEVTAPAKSIITLFEEHVAKNPNKIALMFSGKMISYADLNDKANHIANYLIKHGVGKGQFVGCYQDQSVERIATLIAILKAGAAYLPLDISLPNERLEMLINDSKPSLIISAAHLSIELANVNCLTWDIQEILESPAITFDEPIDYTATHTGDDLVYVIYTSGTTGTPKGVLIQHKSINNFIREYSEVLDIREDDNAIQFSSINFDGSVIDMWLPLAKGCTLFLYPNNKILGDQLSEFICLNNITIIPFMSPSVLSTFTPIAQENSLRVVGIGSERCPDWVSEAWQNKVRLVNGYGPTECTVAVNNYIYSNAHPINTLGTVINNMRFYVLDNYLRPVRKGVIGELYLSGIQLAKGYLNQPELTAEKFIANPYQTTAESDKIFDRLYSTGDQVKILPDGALQYIGRKDHQVKIRGYRVELAEIEKNIIQIEGVEQTVVSIHQYSENNVVIRAFIVGNADISNIKNILANKLPVYMVPSEFIPIDAIPLNISGKINNHALNEIALNFKKENASQNILLPETENEKIIAGIWSELLECEITNIEDDFFNLGGHSLLLTKLYNKLFKHYPNTITMSELYTNSTIKKLAIIIEDRLKNPTLSTYALGKDPLSMEIWADANVDAEMFKFDLDKKGDFVNPKAMFLTGATGFVGANLLLDLLKSSTADIYVLIRAKDEAHAEERLIKAIKGQLLSMEHYDAARVKILVGDLAQPFLGLGEERYMELSDTIDVVYHSGSAVNFIQPYSYMRPANVDALHTLIKFVTTTKLKQLSLLSSVGVFSWEHYFTKPDTNYENANLDSAFKYLSRDMGYTQSKWVMEKVAQKAISQGVPIIIFRLGYVFGHSETGATATYQWWSLMVRTCIQLKRYPILRQQKEELVMIDFVTQSIAHISRNPEAIGEAFHLSCTDENNIALMDFFEMLKTELGFDLSPMPYHEWLALWENDENSPLYPLLNLFKFVAYDNKSIIEIHQDTPDFDISNTNKFIAGTNIENRAITKATLEAYCKYIGVL